MEQNREQTIQFLADLIRRCEKMQPKFAEGTAQHTLLQNRIKALQIAQAVLRQDGSAARFPAAELEKALPPLLSIRHKSAKAQSKYGPETAQYRRYLPLLQAMQAAETALQRELSARQGGMGQ